MTHVEDEWLSSTEPGLQAGSLPSFSSRMCAVGGFGLTTGMACLAVPLVNDGRPFPATGTLIRNELAWQFRALSKFDPRNSV